MIRSHLTSLLLVILLATTASAQNPFAVQAPYKGVYEGKHANATVSLRLLSDDARYTGTLTIGRNQYTLQAKPTPGQLTGEFFDESGAAAPFVCRIDPKADTLIIQRADGNVRLTRVPVPDNIWGHWKGEGIDLYLTQPEGSTDVSGLIFFQGGKFPLTGQYELGQLDGVFKSSDQTYPFEVQTRKAETLHFISGPFAEELTRQAGDDLWKAHKALTIKVSNVQDMKPILPFVRQEVIAALILLEDVQNEIQQATAKHDALAWTETVARHEEMTKARQNLGFMVDTFKPRVSQRLFNDSQKIINNQPTEADQKKAFELMLQAAELDFSPAMLRIGDFYKVGTGVEQNLEKAMHWYRRVAESGVAKLVRAAQNNIGLMYYRGEGVAKDGKEAIKWLQRAADNGYTSAAKNLKAVKGQLLYNEARALRKNNPSKADLKESFEFMLEAAEYDHIWAMLHTASNYERGRGVKQNFKEAMRWYLKVAELNHNATKTAQNNIGLMYYRGQGVPQDTAEAIKWFQRALDNGYTKAAKNIEYIQSQNQEDTQ